MLEEAAARRAAEAHAAAIGEERERLRVTLRSIGDGVIATDAQGRVTLLNPIAEALTGWSSAQAAGEPLQTVFPTIDESTRQPVENPVARVLREGTAVALPGRTVLISKQGVERPVDDSAAPIKDDRGRLLGVVLVFRDGTQQRARDSLRAARLAVTQTLIEAETIHAAAPRILAALGENLGWKAGAFWLADPKRQEMRCLDRWHRPPAPAPGFPSGEQGLVRRMGSGLPGRVWASGQPTWISDTEADASLPRAADAGFHAAFAFPIRAGGEVLGVIEIFREDVCEPDADLMEMASSIGTLFGQFMERKSAEERLRSEREWFHTTLASIGDGVITTDTEGKVTFLNPVAESLTGWSHEGGAYGMPLAIVFNTIDEQSRQPLENPLARSGPERRSAAGSNHTVLIARDRTDARSPTAPHRFATRRETSWASCWCFAT